MSKILEVLVKASERAACIARSCTGSALLVAEKSTDANCRFERDFKTIADVLAQESAKIEISKEFPELANNVRGEECAEIGGVSIKLCETMVETKEMLSALIPSKTAEDLAEAAHIDINLTLDLPSDLPNLNPDDLGVWIDPIDATAEFIAGIKGDAGTKCGLPCVTVLIGAYLKSTGEPIIGVINQPFHNDTGRIIWGVCYDNVSLFSGMESCDCDEEVIRNIILTSAAEKSDVKDKLAKYYTVKNLPGAGYKLMNVALNKADAYLVSHGTTYRWDTCAPHAIIKSRGGEILKFTDLTPVTYHDPNYDDTQHYCNIGGIIAFTDYSVLENIQKLLNED